ncbi:trans-aconitate 2-methyltransferase [Oceanicola sp. 502str15]|uniref:class I SAM-dependent methyltransferase n=1 Tax=Oceanicola sp. 502str15 TaxID=2696061 RepID=UPI002094134B|nr:class I SAM-dependent methyltransferase [Oceanicola sp. 502str15]MCO6384965.1 methyltransferase domain-containing protein [Oceanicola sp. 502str15]
MRPEDTLAIYDARVEDYVAMGAALKERPDLDAFMARLPEGAHVLDLGCGPGFSAALMVARGFAVDAVDGSAGMVARACAQPGVQARQARFEEITGAALYDGVWANFSLLHAPRGEFPEHLARLHRALKPGGWLHLGMKLGEGEGPDSIGRFYSYYSEAELEGLLAGAGFEIAGRRVSRGKGLSGDASEFIVLHAQAIPEGPTKG